MAQMQSIYSCAIILAVITCHGILSAEGRQLKPMKRQVGVQTVSSTKDNFPPPSTKSMESTTVAVPIDDFRPTTPGNSPGVGHSYAQQHNGVVQPNEVSEISKLLTKESKQESTRKQKISTVAGSIDGFRPTAPGNSPGVGHFYSKNDVKVQQKGVGIGPESPDTGHSNAGNTDDFKPTQPGHSPGVGHSLKDKNTEPNA